MFSKTFGNRLSAAKKNKASYNQMTENLCLMNNMKTRTTLIPILLVLTIFSCENNDKLFVPTIDGLSLYWDHEVFGNEGRRVRFEGSSTNEFDNDYELVFNTLIEANAITVRLVKSANKGKCQYFPMPAIGDDDPRKCNASGKFYLSDKELTNGIYSLKIITPSFEVASELTVDDEKIILEIPRNDYLKSSIKNVYPIPKHLLFGSVVYQGSNNTNDAEEFLTDLMNLGLIETTVPNYPYRHLSIDENGHPIESHWEPDNHSIGFLYKMNNIDFKTIFEESKEYFNQTNLNIHLFTSNGDEGHMSKTAGITVVYGQ